MANLNPENSFNLSNSFAFTDSLCAIKNIITILVLGIIFTFIPYEVKSQTLMKVKIIKIDSIKFKNYGYFDFHIKTKRGKEHILVDTADRKEIEILTKNIGKKMTLNLGMVLEFRTLEGIFLRHDRVYISEVYEDGKLLIDLSETADERYYSIYK